MQDIKNVVLILTEKCAHNDACPRVQFVSASVRTMVLVALSVPNFANSGRDSELTSHQTSRWPYDNQTAEIPSSIIFV